MTESEKKTVERHEVRIGDIVVTSYGEFKVADIEEDNHDPGRGWMELTPVYEEQ